MQSLSWLWIYNYLLGLRLISLQRHQLQYSPGLFPPLHIQFFRKGVRQCNILGCAQINHADTLSSLNCWCAGYYWWFDGGCKAHMSIDDLLKSYSIDPLWGRSALSHSLHNQVLGQFQHKLTSLDQTTTYFCLLQPGVTSNVMSNFNMRQFSSLCA